MEPAAPTPATAHHKPARERREPADLVYRAVRALVSVSMRLFFRRIAIRGRENIPASGPVVLAANHPSGLIDTFSIALATSRKVNFVARSTLFRSPARARLLARLGIIPVYRRMDAGSEMGTNVEVFEHCYELLERGGVIGIFPEGVTHVDPQVREMKTGAVRIALEAEARRQFLLGVCIVPVGLNFSKPGAYRSDLTLRVGEPMVLKRYESEFRAAPAATVRKLTEELRSRIESLIVHLADLSKRPMVEAACELFAAEWVGDPWVLPDLEDEATREIEVKRRIAAAVEYYSRFQPAWAVALQEKIGAHRAALERLHVTEEMLRRRVGAVPLLGETLPAAVIGILGAPLALFGWLINALPQLVTGWAARHFAANQTQLAAYKMWIGLQAFAVFYGLLVFAFHRYLEFGRLAMLVFLLLFPIAGYLSSRYFALMKHYWRNVWITYLHLRHRGRLQELRFRRERLARDREKILRFFFADADVSSR
jgi:1-acyl-sn-glycerol-3-phosphate acyltransferase